MPGKGLPEDVLVAYAKNKAIALLVDRPEGDLRQAVKGYTKRLDARDDVEVFIVKAKKIAQLLADHPGGQRLARRRPWS